jgi:hypothetical protein
MGDLQIPCMHPNYSHYMKSFNREATSNLKWFFAKHHYAFLQHCAHPITSPNIYKNPTYGHFPLEIVTPTKISFIITSMVDVTIKITTCLKLKWKD